MSAFGKRLRELRVKAGLSQRELAKKVVVHKKGRDVGVDFTYLSKIETGNMAPPSEQTIRALAKELNTDANELILLAEKMPSDLAAHIVEQPEAAALLRSIEGKIYSKEEWAELLKFAEESGKTKR